MSTKRGGVAVAGAVITCAVFALHSRAQNSDKPFHKPLPVQDTVDTDAGVIKGLPADAAGIRMFKGVPYAAAPIGNRRWRAPVRPGPWEGVKPAIEFSADCVQAAPADRHPVSEDCLYLNIWTGAQTIAERRPVLVWIHGGGFTAGTGRDPRINGENLARRGIVVVTFNYRVGAFGFLAHPELTSASETRTSGNYGLLDQLAALSWVQRNIMKFGGDPQNVTLGGNSAGALCVNLLVGSPLGKNQFRRVIAESGADVSSFSVSYPLPLKTNETAGIEFMKTAGADSLAALRRVPAADLLKIRGGNRMSIDGHVIPQDPYQIFATGKQNDVPILNGWNRDDVAAGGNVETAAAFKDYVRKGYGAEADAILRMFPAATDAQAKRSAEALSRDVLFAWQGYTWVRLQERTGKAGAYTYYFTRVPPDTPQQMARGVFHGSESPYALDNLDKFKRPYTETDRKLSAVMSSFWVNYMRSGNPNGTGLPEWPRFSAKADRVMEFGDAITSRPTPFKDEMVTLDEVFDRLRKMEPQQLR
jgi:para-nitrobenzyl esterase